MNGRAAHQLNDAVQSTKVPSWLTKERAVLIPKDPAKGNMPSNIRPITCLPLMWKLLTSMISDKITEHMAEKNLLSWEKKSAQKEEEEQKGN